MQLSDHDLIINIGRGNKKCYHQLFDNYYDNLCQYAYTIVKDMDEAKDIVQNIFLKLWENRMQLEITHIKTYLYRAVYHNSINQLEYKAVRERFKYSNMQSQYTDNQLPEVFSGELEENVRTAIGLLPARCREIFIMSRYNELKYSEIADKLGISVNTVENQMSKALRILRERLDTFIK